ncbi:methyl-accepting chemotaxis protein [Cohnella zeiphila]|uniref:Methyl-accepting chemotaxis protein n=1 Tax=Cohnella zeiphila TaxID=2761120 RepID=A0A7X0SQU2_9BACL|nr:methyl-accepting chemotaxis protein [Cohnella zeiphila]MBB6734261.1 methyl-accepting chemotaxis protein [Cohnella zeiphila]
MMKTNPSQRKWGRSSVRLKLSAILLALSILPLLGSTLFFIQYFTGVSKTDNEQIQLTVEELNISRIDEWMQSKLSALQELINQNKDEFQTADPAKTIPLLKVLDESDKEIDSFTMIGPDGNGIDTNHVAIDVSDRDHFIKAKETKQPVISDMLISKKTNKYVMPLDIPLLDASGQFVGAVTASVSPDILTALTNKIKIGDTGFGYIISGRGEYYTYPDSSRIGKSWDQFDPSASEKAAFQKILAGSSGSVEYRETGGKQLLVHYATIPNTNWKLIVAAPKSEIMQNVNHAETLAVWIIIGVLLLVGLIAVLLTGLIVKPILAISEVMKKVATGHLKERVRVRSKDEIGQMSGNINEMIDSLTGIVRQIDTTIGQVAAASEDLQRSAEQSSDAASQIAASIQEVADGADTQLQGAEQSARAMEEMAGGIQRIAESSGSVADLTAGVASEVEDGVADIRSAIEQMDLIGASAGDAASAMEELTKRSDEIGRIVDVISDISNQTALLSLNASIEAARAGEQGRGFAVVANEVKKLAEQTQRSVEDISGLIGGIQQTSDSAMRSMQRNVEAIGDGVRKMRSIGEGFEQIRVAVRDAAGQIQDISATTEQLSAGTEEISASFEEMVGISRASAENAQTVAGSTEEQSAISEDITASAQTLNQRMTELKSIVQVFKV